MCELLEKNWVVQWVTDFLTFWLVFKLHFGKEIMYIYLISMNIL